MKPYRHPRLNCEPCGINGTLTNPISPDGHPELGKIYDVPARQGRAVRVSKGQSIRIVNTHGTQVCDTWAFSADNHHEFMSWEHGRPALNRITPRTGDILASNRRRPIMTMIEDSSIGVHDTLMAACDLYRYETLGHHGYHDNCADNLRLALSAIGVSTPEVPQPLNLWMNIPVRQDLSVEWLAPVCKAGDHVTLRAEMDCIVVMSACPQDILPINGDALNPVEVHFSVHD